MIGILARLFFWAIVLVILSVLLKTCISTDTYRTQNAILPTEEQIQRARDSFQ